MVDWRVGTAYPLVEWKGEKDYWMVEKKDAKVDSTVALKAFLLVA